jgi:hypothetical protein
MKRRETGGNRGECRVFMIRRAILLAALAALLCSCAAPFIERAIDPPGVSYSLGAGSNINLDGERGMTDNPPYAAWDICATGAVRQTLSRVSSVSFQAEYSAALPVRDWIHDRPMVDACLAYKYTIGRSGALKGEIGVGWAKGYYQSFETYPVLSIAYLQDFGRHFTGRARLGFDLLALDVNWHAPVSDFAAAYVNLGFRQLPVSVLVWSYNPAFTVPGMTLGLGLEFGRIARRFPALRV